MTAIKLLSASLIFAAATSAFAGTDDGNVASFPAQTRVVAQAPAPAAAAATTRAYVKTSAKQDFTAQQAETSGN